jgi:predicted nucleotidyltransferase
MKRPDEKTVEAEIRKIVTALTPYHPKKVILFGSFARKDYHGLSDLDLIIIKETEKKFLDRIVEVLELCDSTIPVEPLVYTPTELEQLLAERNSFITQVLSEGRVLYEQT